MRFEVKGGGIAAILFALTLLSGAVFMLGLLAGYDVGRQAQIDAAQLATSYPLQSAPISAAPSNQPSPGPAKAATASVSDTSSPAGGAPTVAATTRPASFAAESTGANRNPSPARTHPARPRLAGASVPGGTAPAPTEDSATGDENSEADSENSENADVPSETASNSDLQSGRRDVSRTSATRHKGYNIQIEAAMDISGADRMMARLRKLGYSSHLVPTEIGGQRWYKVEVGPYATAEEASNAEAEMRQKYDQSYGGGARGKPPQRSADQDSDE